MKAPSLRKLVDEEMRKLSLEVSITALIAPIYSILTVVLGELGYSWIQIRVSEALTPLPFLMGFPAVAGLTLGCLIANLFSPVGLPDIIFGPMLTLCAAFLSWKANFGRKILACIYPIVVNAFGVSLYVSAFYNVPYAMSLATIAIGEFIAALLIGYPLLISIEKVIKARKGHEGVKAESHIKTSVCPVTVCWLSKHRFLFPIPQVSHPHGFVEISLPSPPAPIPLRFC